MKKKKTSWISFIMPYVIIIGIIVVISLVFSQGSSNRASFSEGEIITTRIGSDSDSEWKTKVERSENDALLLDPCEKTNDITTIIPIIIT